MSLSGWSDTITSTLLVQHRRAVRVAIPSLLEHFSCQPAATSARIPSPTIPVFRTKELIPPQQSRNGSPPLIAQAHQTVQLSDNETADGPRWMQIPGISPLLAVT